MSDEQSLEVQTAVTAPEVAKVSESTQTAPQTESAVSTPSEQPSAEKLYTREQLARASKDASKHVYDKAYQDALRDFQEKNKQQQMQASAPVQQSTGPIDENRAREIARQERVQADQQRQYEDYHNNLTMNFMGKVEAAKIDDPEITVKLKDLGMGVEDTYPNDPRVALFNSIDNLGDVVSEMHKNPSKYGQILELLALDVNKNTSLSFRELRNLSESIKVSKAAKELPKSPKPATQVEPSNAGLSSGEASISAERKKAMYRF